MKHILFVETRTDLPGINMCLEKGWKVTLLAEEPIYYYNAVKKENYSVLNQIIVQAPTSNENDLFEFIYHINKKNKLDLILSFSELYVSQAAVVAEKLGLPTMSSIAIKTARNKFKTRNICKYNNIPIPKYLLATNKDEAVESARKIGYPCIFKPMIGASSLGVRLVDNEKDMIQIYERYLIDSNRYFGRNIYSSKEVLIEEYIKGEVYSAETITINGSTEIIGFANRGLFGFPYFVENEVIFPYKIHNEQKAKKVVNDVIRKVGIDFGLCHVEIIINESDVKLIEINPRLAGGPIRELINLSLGIDLANEIINFYLGEPYNFKPCRKKVAGSHLICAERDGVLKSVKEEKPILEYDDVKKLEIFKLGQFVKKAKSNADWIGIIIVVGDEQLGVKSRLSQLLNMLHFEIR